MPAHLSSRSFLHDKPLTSAVDVPVVNSNLKRLPLSLFRTVASGLSVFVPMTVQAATSSIEQITIYQGLASVTRALPISGSGEQTLIVRTPRPPAQRA